MRLLSSYRVHPSAKLSLPAPFCILFTARHFDRLFMVCRQWFYYFLTDSGVEYLRQYLYLEENVVPATLKKPAKPSGVREGAGDRGFGGGRGGFGRGGFDKEGGYRREGGFRGGFGRGAGAPPAAAAAPAAGEA